MFSRKEFKMKGKKMNKKVVYGAFTGALVVASVGLTLSVTNSRYARADEASAPAATLAANNLTSELVDETVYVFLGTDGSVKKTISSDWTKNDLGADVYSKNEGKVSTPIEMKITYFLDGKEVSADDIRGRSGQVKIRYDYTNTERVNGMYVPYAVLSGAVLPNEHFTNVKVTNGRLVNDGNRTVVVGLALPGMKENLGVSANIPEYVEIEAEAKEFKMEMTATVATSKVFADIDTSALNSIDSLSAQLNTLVSSMEQLMDGSAKLRDGLSELDSKIGVLADGVSQLKNGSLQLVAGMESLQGGAYNALTGAKQLDAGIDQTISGINTLASNLATLDQNSATLKSGVQTLISAVFAEINDSRNPLLQGVTIENYREKFANAIATLTQMGDTENAEKMKNTAEKIGQQIGLYQGIIQYIDGASTIAQGAAGIDLSGLKDGSAQLVNGLGELYAGTDTLYTGMQSLDAGISNLESNVPALTDGVNKLADGSRVLTDGLSQFNAEGVQKLVSLYNGDVKALVNRIQSMVSLAKNSNTKVKYIYRTAEI